MPQISPQRPRRLQIKRQNGSTTSFMGNAMVMQDACCWMLDPLEAAEGASRLRHWSHAERPSF